MPTFSFLSSSSTLCALVICFLTLFPRHISAFSFQKTSFDSEIVLHGSARISNGGSPVTLTPPLASSFGLVAYNRSFRLLEATSFSTEFSFSISAHDGDTLALVVLPNDFASKLDSSPSGLSRKIQFLGVEFDISMDKNVGDPDGNHAKIEVGCLVSASVGRLSSANLSLNSGEKLRSWVDYNASSKRLRVWLSKLGASRPKAPVLSCPIDLWKMWKGEEVLLGISASSGNSSQASSVYSWSFRLNSVPNWLHSQPVDPRPERRPPLRIQKRNVCPFTVLAEVIFAAGCLGLMALVLVFVGRNTTSATAAATEEEEHPKFPVDFRYLKINVVEGTKAVN